MTQPRSFGTCAVCGEQGTYLEVSASIRESFVCQHCHASLRCRAQAAMLLRWLTLPAPLSRALPGLASLRIYEPGIGGPFRRWLRALPNYQQSYFWPDRQPHKGIPFESLEALSLPDASFDVVITSDIFEHIQRPWQAFAEVRRVLRPGGIHCFTVPMICPFPSATVVRIAEDGTPLLPVQHHRSPIEGEPCPVVTDWGSDLIDRLNASGWQCQVDVLSYNVTIIAQHL